MKFIGFLIFLTIALMGFSMLIFLALFVGYWITLTTVERFNPDLANRMVGHKASSEE